MEQIVVARGFLPTRADTIRSDAKIVLEPLGHPKEHRHMSLDVRSDRVGKTVEIYASFAQRLAMISYVEHGGLILPLLVAQPFNELGQQMICVQNSIVVGVDDLLPAAGAKIGGITRRREPREFWCVTEKVTRTVVTELMKDDEAIVATAKRKFLQRVEQYGVETTPLGTRLARKHGGTLNKYSVPIADAFAARIVILPADLVSRMAEDLK